MTQRIWTIVLLLPLVTSAADRWVPVAVSTPPIGAQLVNIGNIAVNGNGNRVATLRVKMKNHQMDILTEFDCVNRRTHALASSVTDNSGQLVSANGESKAWLTEKQSAGLAAVCEASPTSP
jgi:hypothetical protein